MTHFEEIIKTLTLDKLAEIYANEGSCDSCPIEKGSLECQKMHCEDKEHWKKWLESEAEADEVQ